MPERRLKAINLDKEMLISVFSDWRKFDCINLPILPSLPEGYRVAEIDFSYSRNCFVVLIEHSSFDVVLPGHPCPYFDERPMQFERYKLVKASEFTVIIPE